MRLSVATRGAARILAIAAMLPTIAGAEGYPSKPITMYVAYGAGATTDITARALAKAAEAVLGVPIAIENKGGGGGTLAAGLLASKKPDGYTLLMALSSLVVLPEADKVLKRAPMFQLDQLKPIARFSADPTVLVVRAESPWKTYAEFMAYVKAHPAKVSFGSSGNYGTMHVPMEQLKAATSSYMLHVPYTGAGPAVMALLSGQIEALSTGPSSVAQQIKAGKLRALAHWGEGRLASLPEVPSLKELGVPIAYAQWSGLFVPAHTPAAVVEKLRQAAKFAAADTRANQAMVASGSSFMFQDAPEFERYVQTDAKDMAALVQRIGKVD